MRISTLLIAPVIACMLLAGCATTGVADSGSTAARHVVADTWSDHGLVTPYAPGLFFAVQQSGKWHLTNVWDSFPGDAAYQGGKVVFFYNYLTGKAHPIFSDGNPNPGTLFKCERNRKPDLGSACASPLREVSTLWKISWDSNPNLANYLPCKFDKNRIAEVLDEVGVDRIEDLARAGRLRKYDQDYAIALKDSEEAREYIADYADMDVKGRIPALKANLPAMVEAERRAYLNNLDAQIASSHKRDLEVWRTRGVRPAQQEETSSGSDSSGAPENAPTWHYKDKDGRSTGDAMDWDGNFNQSVFE